MISLGVKDHQFYIDDVQIVSIEIQPINFAPFILTSNEAVSASKSDLDYKKRILRQRMINQCTPKITIGMPIKFTHETISAMPPRLGILLSQQLSAELNAASSAELLSDPKADGISSSIHVRLGSPIKAQGGKEIAELEFIAKNLGSVENLIVAENRLDQMLALMEVAVPAGGLTLLALPSWAVDQITLADGLFMMREVLPRFLGEAATANAAL